jgi:hypothetical protein
MPEIIVGLTHDPLPKPAQMPNRRQVVVRERLLKHVHVRVDLRKRPVDVLEHIRRPGRVMPVRRKPHLMATLS